MNTAIHAFHIIGICPQQICLAHGICMSHCTNTIVTKSYLIMMMMTDVLFSMSLLQVHDNEHL